MLSKKHLEYPLKKKKKAELLKQSLFEFLTNYNFLNIVECLFVFSLERLKSNKYYKIVKLTLRHFSYHLQA